MAVKHHHRRKAQRHHRAGTPESATAISAAEYHVPFWLLWGIAGAESTWGEGGSNLFGLLDAAEGANISSWRSASKQAAKTLRGLKDQYGTWAAAVQHYSGYSYTIDHPRQLAAERSVPAASGGSTNVTPANSHEVQVSLLEDIPKLFTNPGQAFGEYFGEEVGKGHGVPNPLAPTEAAIGAVSGAAGAVEAFFSLVTDLQFWIRALEVGGGLILTYMALRSLTGTGFSDLPGYRVASSATKAAAYKQLPPKQRVKS